MHFKVNWQKPGLKIKAPETMIDIAEEQFKIASEKSRCQTVIKMKHDYLSRIEKLSKLFGKTEIAYY